MERHIIQICAISETAQGYQAIYALCNDGTLWVRYSFNREIKGWIRVERIPQDDFDRAEAISYRMER